MPSPIPLDNLGRYGFINDPKAHTIPAEAFSSVRNMRFREDAAERVLGHQPVYGQGTVPAYFLMPWFNTSSAENNWIYASFDAIYSVTGVTHTDITRSTGGAYSAGEYLPWVGVVFGGIPILNNASLLDDPQSWDGTSNMQDLPNWPASTTCKVVRSFGNFLVALYLRVSGTDFPYLVRWSDIASPGTVPSSWDVTDDTVRAGETPLSRTGGVVIDSLPLGPINLIYKEDSIHTMRFIGGQQVFAFDEAISDRGLLTVNCARNITKRRHFCVGSGDVYVHNGQTWDSVISRRNARFLFNSIEEVELSKTFVVRNDKTKEMYVCYVESGTNAIYPNRAATWNWENNTWGFQDLPETQIISAGIVEIAGADDTWDLGPDTTWDVGADVPWDGDLGARAGLKDLLAATIGGSAELLTNGAFTVDLSGWTVAVPVVVWDSGNGGQAEFDDFGAIGTSRLTQAIATIIGETYTMTTDLSLNGANDQLTIYIGTTDGGFEVLSRTIPTSGQDQFQFVATATTTYVSFLAFDTTTDAYNVTVQNASVTGPGSVFMLMESTDQFDGVSYTGTLERVGLTVVGRSRTDQDTLKVDPTVRKLITRWFPKIESAVPVNLYFGQQDRINEPVLWNGPFAFDPNTDGYIDFTMNTRFIAYRVESTEAFKMFGLWMNLSPAGGS